MDEQQVASGLQRIDEVVYSAPKLLVGLACRRLEIAELAEDLGVGGIRLLIRTALERTEVALSQTPIGAWLRALSTAR